MYVVEGEDVEEEEHDKLSRKEEKQQGFAYKDIEQVLMIVFLLVIQQQLQVKIRDYQGMLNIEEIVVNMSRKRMKQIGFEWSANGYHKDVLN